MTAKSHPDLTKREALVLAWKSRSDYKGYDKSKGSSFNSWRAIVYTDKGKKTGFPESWKDYAVFMREVGGEWAKGRIVTRIDTTVPHGPGNSFWADKGTEVVSRLVKLVFNGAEKTLVEWCNEYGLHYNGVRQRYFKGKGYSVEEILFGKKRKQRTPKERSADFRTARMFGAYRLRDKRKGVVFDITLSFMRDEIAKGCVYCGDVENVGLDRIDNSKGHTVDNVVPCCYVCNCARNDNFNHEEMLHIGKAIAQVKRLRDENRQKRVA